VVFKFSYVEQEESEVFDDYYVKLLHTHISRHEGICSFVRKVE
jgi:hypothetical protein